MKIFFMKILCIFLVRLCDLTHRLPDKKDEELHEWFIEIIGYSCPFAMWSYRINKKYNFNIWWKK